MSAPRSRLGTVLRVAALQERLAKAEAGRAATAVDTAVQIVGLRREALAAAALRSGSPADLHAARALQGLRARAVGEAQEDVSAAEARRSTSLDAWRSARSRTRLLEQLDARLREEQEAVRAAAAQRLADDLAARRREQDA